MRTSEIFVTVDSVVFRKLSTSIQVALIKRRNNPFKDLWALPGGFVDHNEDLHDAAVRELREETGLLVHSMQQVYAFGKPGRDPRGHTISITYYSCIEAEKSDLMAADDATEARWFSVDALPPLAFDHKEIINFTRSKFSI